jgi:hypothetical protein
MIDVQKNFIEKQRVTVQRGPTSKSDAAQYSKQIKILENRLDKAN